MVDLDTDPVPADAASAVIDFTHRIHQALVGVYGAKAEDILLRFRDELYAQIESNSQVESACRDGLQLAISTHVPIAACHARLLRGLAEARNIDDANTAADAGGHETQAAAPFKRSDERLQAIARINVAWGKDILEHYKFDQVGRTTAVGLAQVAQLYPDWTRAVQRINAAMLGRHISSLTGNGQRIGDHHSTSNVKDRDRPIEAVDAKLVTEWRRQGIVELEGSKVADSSTDLSQDLQQAIDEWTTCEAVSLKFQRIQRPVNPFYVLCKDRHGLLVPQSSARNQKRKRPSRSGAGQRKKVVHSGSSPETRQCSRSDSTEQPASNTCHVSDRGSLLATGCNFHAASASVETATGGVGRVSETVVLNIGDIEGDLSTEGPGQRSYPSIPRSDTCEQPGEAHARSALNVSRHHVTPGKTPSLHFERDNDSLFINGSDQSSPPLSQSAPHGLGSPFRDVASRGASLASATDRGHSVTTVCTDDGPDGLSGSFTTCHGPGFASTVNGPGTALSPPPACSVAPDTATRNRLQALVETDSEDELEVSPGGLPDRSSFFEEEYNATMAGRSPQLFSHNCPSCIGPCAVGKAPESWTGMKSELLHARLVEVHRAFGDTATLPDSQLTAWIDGLRGASIFFEPNMPQSCEKSDADAYCLTIDALKCHASDSVVLDRPTIVRSSDDSQDFHVGNSASTLRPLVETHMCLVGNRWLRSLRGTHLCMIPSQASMRPAGQASFQPRGNSRAIFLDAADILFIPQGTPSAVFTFEDSLLQSGTIRDCSYDVQLRAHELVQGLGEILTMPSSLVRT